MKPGVAGVHETVADPGPAATIVRVGAPGIWTATAPAQKPPCNV
jgi:hypothetical protein